MGLLERRRRDTTKEQLPPGQVLSRRRFFRRLFGLSLWAIIAGDTNVTEAVMSAALERVINAKVLIPEDLQQPTILTGKMHVRVGIGDSNMAGQGDRNIPLVDRVVAYAIERGIQMTAISEAENGSLSSALPQQARKAKERIPKGFDVGVEIWTGENDIKTNQQLLEAVTRISKDFLDFVSWRTFLDRLKSAREALQYSLEQNAIQAALELGTQSITLYGLSPVQYAKRIIDIDPETGKQRYILVKDALGIAGKVNQAVAAYLVQQGTEAVVAAARALKNRGYSVTVVDSASEIRPSDYNETGDQHFGPQAAKRVAGKRASLFRKQN